MCGEARQTTDNHPVAIAVGGFSAKDAGRALE
jgi:hypothetical protein